jgi:DNA-nicking Smr family endonuclease
MSNQQNHNKDESTPAHLEDDCSLFRAAVADVQPLQHDYIEPYHKKYRPYPRELPIAHPSIPLLHSEQVPEVADYLFYNRPGIQHRVLNDLRRGRIPALLELDLHGLTSEHAHETLCEFLIACQQRQVRCARIIHGKGLRSVKRQPVLKRQLNFWLRQCDDVLAFCSTPQHEGGTGAVYVLLRKTAKRTMRVKN